MMIHEFTCTVLPMAIVAFTLLNVTRADETFEGTVVTATGILLTVQDLGNGDYRSFDVDPHTDIILNGEPARLSDLYPFFQVKVIAEYYGGTWYATEIVATSAVATSSCDRGQLPMIGDFPARGANEIVCCPCRA